MEEVTTSFQLLAVQLNAEFKVHDAVCQQPFDLVPARPREIEPLGVAEGTAHGGGGLSRVGWASRTLAAAFAAIFLRSAGFGA